MSNTRNRIRIAGDLADPYRELIDLTTGRSPVFPRARAVRVDLAIEDNGVFQTSIAQFTSITLEIKPAETRTGAPLVSKTVSAASFDNTTTHNNWLNGTKQHLVFQLTEAETQAFTVGSNFDQALWVAVTAVSPDGNVTLIGGTATALEDGGLASGAAPAAGDPTYYTKEQIDALIQAIQFGDVVMRSPNGQWERRLGVTDKGKRIDAPREIT